jgi:hypothetical protein
MDAGSPWRELLTQLGIDPGTGLAGFSGSLVQILRMKIKKPALILGQAVSGTLIATYLGKTVSGFTSVPAEAVGFVIGYGGIQLLEYMLAIARQRFAGATPPSAPSNGGPKDAST